MNNSVVDPWKYGGAVAPSRGFRGRRFVIIVGLVIAVLLVALTGVYHLNSSKTTCGLVGCFGWCTSVGPCGSPPGLPGPGVYGPEWYGNPDGG